MSDGASSLDPRRAFVQTLEALRLVQRSPDRFEAYPGDGASRLFGGLVAAQSALAARQTVAPERSLHSMHAYFLRLGRMGRTIELEIERVRDGGSFSTRRVVARQRGEAIFTLTASFALPEEGIEHDQAKAPSVSGPEGLVDREQERARHLPDGTYRHFPSALEVRLCDPAIVVPGAVLPAIQNNWMRPYGEVPEDSDLHLAMLVYMSDRALLSTAELPHGIPYDERRAASLDHALWIHRTPEMNQWHLFACESPVARSSRGLVQGALYDEQGRRIASVSQEALLRRARRSAPAKPRS